MKHYFCDVCKSRVDKEDIAKLLAMSEDNEILEEWGDLCQNCRDKLSKILKEWKGK